MGSTQRRADRSLIDVLRGEAHRFELLQSLHILEEKHTDKVRFRTALGDRSPSIDVIGITSKAPVLSDGTQQTSSGEIIETGIISFFGAHGPLPAPIADMVHDEFRTGNEGPREFFDIFANRLIRLLLKTSLLDKPILEKTRPADSSHAHVLKTLIGRANRKIGANNPVWTLIDFAGLLHQRPASLYAAASIISIYFNVRAKANALVGRWMTPADEDCTRLSARGSGSQLGRSSVLGNRVWIQDAKVVLVIGPVGLRLFKELLPGGSGHAALRTLGKISTPQEVDLQCDLIIKADEVPTAKLGNRDGSQLGWTTWLAANTKWGDRTIHMQLQETQSGGAYV